MMMRALLASLMLFILANSSVSIAKEALRPMSEVDYLATESVSVKQSKKIIMDIVNSENLKGEIGTKWKIKAFDFETSNETPEWMNVLSVIFATIIEYALWILLVIGIIMLYLTRYQWLYLFSANNDKKEEYQAPDILFGMDVREASLPDNLLDEAKLLWQQQKARDSLSLLYRGALVHLLNKEKLPLENSHTEGDILKLSKKMLFDNKQHYLSQLTTQWQLVAYAHRIPNEEAMDWLFTHWQQDFSNAGVAEVKS